MTHYLKFKEQQEKYKCHGLSEVSMEAIHRLFQFYQYLEHANSFKQ